MRTLKQINNAFIEGSRLNDDELELLLSNYETVANILDALGDFQFTLVERELSRRIKNLQDYKNARAL